MRLVSKIPHKIPEGTSSEANTPVGETGEEEAAKHDQRYPPEGGGRHQHCDVIQPFPKRSTHACAMLHLVSRCLLFQQRK